MQPLYLLVAAGAARRRDRRRPVRPRSSAARRVALAVHPRRGGRVRRLVSSIFRDVHGGHSVQRRRLHLAARRATSSSTIGFLIDPLTATMMLRGHLRVADGARLHHRLHGRRPRLHALLLATSRCSRSAMLMLVMSNNFLQLFFGWEAVGLVSYLLIGFWYTRPTAIYANLKAFLVNRVGDFGFVLGIGLVARVLRHARLRDGVRQAPALAGDDDRPVGRVAVVAADGRSASACSSARWARARRSRCTSGCPTRWKARRRSPR